MVEQGLVALRDVDVDEPSLLYLGVFLQRTASQACA
jgi:hypothetical protein